MENRQFLRNALKVALGYILTDVEVRKDGVIVAMPTLRPPDWIQLVVNRTWDLGRFVFSDQKRTKKALLSALERTRSITTTPIRSITLAGIRRDCSGRHEHTIVFEKPI